MDSSHQAERFLRSMEALFAAQDAGARDRWLVRAAVASGAGRAAALWRRAPSDMHANEPRSGEPEVSWREVVAVGARELLPSAREIDALLARALDGFLPSDRWILALERGGQPAALAIAGLGSGEAALDLVEALFRVLALVDDAEPPLTDPLRRHLSQIVSPLPSPLPDLRAIEAALADFARDVDGGASVLTRALERELERLSRSDRCPRDEGDP